MDIREHILYQNLFIPNVPIEDIINTFNRILEEERSVDIDEILNAQSHPELDQCILQSNKAVQRAAIIKYIFEQFEYNDILDLINLAIKEKLARNLLILQNTKEAEIRSIEDALDNFCQKPVGKRQLNATMATGIRVNLINEFISENLHYIGIAKKHILMRDINAILKHVIGEHGTMGRIGGKSAGMILANRILRPCIRKNNEYDGIIEEVESYFIKSQVFARFIQYNKLEECYNLKYLEHEEIEKIQSSLYDRIIEGSFPPFIEEQLKELLSTMAGSPIIVRSSSLLEDNIGFPFCGKYDSYFISNRGKLHERYDELTKAIKRVYFSIYKLSAIQYRKDKNLVDFNENMCILIQKVVGSRYGKYFFPALSGVAFSQNYYRWSRKLKKEDGMARIVLGLGTRAVERVGDDYPRIISFTNPNLRPEGTLGEKMKYSQKKVDVLNLEEKGVETVHYIDLYNSIGEIEKRKEVFADVVSLVREGSLEVPIIFPEKLKYGESCISFDRVIEKKNLFSTLKKILKHLEREYKTPVDVEFAFNQGKLYILQCRPLFQNDRFTENIEMPSYDENELLFATNKVISGNTVIKNIRYLVFVDVDKYSRLGEPHYKLEVARIVGAINRRLRSESFILLGPGRWGSSNIDLGVKVSYSDINNSKMLVEIAKNTLGYTPEASYGTHFFQDIIEAGIAPLPLYPGEPNNYLKEAFLKESPNSLLEILDEQYRNGQLEDYREVVRIIDLKSLKDKMLSVYINADTNQGLGILI